MHFCQLHIPKLKTNCPADSKLADVGVGYRILCETVAAFIRLGQLPSDIVPHVQYWDEGDGMESTFMRHRASWHIKCKQKFVHVTKLGRLSAADTTDTADTDTEKELGDEQSTGVKVPRIARSHSTQISPVCFFCDLPGTDLRQVMTFAVNDRVCKRAAILQDSMLLAKLATGDMIATEAKYHPSCLLNLYYKAGRVQSSEDNTGNPDDTLLSDICGESLALAQVIAYIEDRRVSVSTPVVFKLSELKKLYWEQLVRHKVPLGTQTHSSRFKERLLTNCPHLTCVSHGRDVLLTFEQHIGVALQQVTEHTDSDAVSLMHAAKLLRSHIFSSSYHFNGSLTDSDKAVPPVLSNFVTMLLEGPGVPDESSHICSEAALSVSQLVTFNAVKHR